MSAKHEYEIDRNKIDRDLRRDKFENIRQAIIQFIIIAFGLCAIAYFIIPAHTIAKFLGGE